MKKIPKSDIKINPEAVASVHDGGLVILDNTKGRVFSSGPAGAYIWQCIEQQLTLEAIAERLHRRFEIAPAIAREHAARFLEQLQGNGLIDRRAA